MIPLDVVHLRKNSLCIYVRIWSLLFTSSIVQWIGWRYQYRNSVCAWLICEEFVLRPKLYEITNLFLFGSAISRDAASVFAIFKFLQCNQSLAPALLSVIQRLARSSLSLVALILPLLHRFLTVHELF